MQRISGQLAQSLREALQCNFFKAVPFDVDSAKLRELCIKLTTRPPRNNHSYRSQRHGFEATVSCDAAPVRNHFGRSYGRG
jgi:hypothetical protein